MNVRRLTNVEAGIFLISFAVLLTELLLTRIFSVTMYFHLSFMVVSLAMLGFAASGLLVTLAPQRFPAERFEYLIARSAVLFAVTSVAAVAFSFAVPISLEQSVSAWLRISAIYVVCAVPFFFGGLVVSLILTFRSKQASRYYALDLAGAALGCLVFIPATNLLGAPSAILFAGAVAATAGWVLARGHARKLASVGLLLAAGLGAASLANSRLNFYDAVFVKGSLRRPMLALKWNSFSRVDVEGTPESLWTPRAPVFSGFSTRLDPEFVIPEVKLCYDADASTQITYFDGDMRRLEYLRYDVSSSVHHLGRHYQDVLVIGPGGGRDVLTALSMGTAHVTGVEINPLTVKLMRTRFRTFTGGLYDGFPGVTIVNEEARSFVRNQSRHYDFIEASLVDTWAASAAGAYSLSENSLYTVEAFEDYLDHLNPDGVVAFNRWFSLPPVEALRVASLAREALARRGVQNPGDHIMALHTDAAETQLPSLGSILVKLSPFSASEIAALGAFAKEMGFVLAYTPDMARPSPGTTLSGEQHDFTELLGPRSRPFVASYPYDLTPVFDDRPFFFNRVPLVAWLISRMGLSDSFLGNQSLGLGQQTLLVAVVASLVATFLLLVLPFWAHRSRRAAPEEEGAPPTRARGLAWAIYFMGLGLGFIMVEIVLLQRFNLYLGYPAYSLSVVLFTLLLTSAAGSFASGKVTTGRALDRMIVVLFLALLLLSVALPALLARTRGLPIAVRILLAIVSIAPLGVLMGVPFASGVRLAGRESQRLVAWGWAINGGASVFGSTLAVVISMTWGFGTTLLAGAGAYALAFLMVAWLSRPQVVAGRARDTELAMEGP